MGFCFQLVDELGHHFRIQRLRFVDIVPLIEASDELVTSDGKGVRGGIGDRNPTNFEVIEFDQGRTSCRWRSLRDMTVTTCVAYGSMCPVYLAVMVVVEKGLMVVSPVAISWSSMSEMVKIC